MSSILFLSCSLRPEDITQVNAHFEYIFEFYGMKTQTINIPGISEEEVIRILRETIPMVDGVVVLWVPRYYINGGLPSVWTILETAMGLAMDKPIYVFYEEGIALEGPLNSIGKIRVQFNRYSLSHNQDAKNTILKGLGILGGLAIMFVLGFLAGRGTKEDQRR